MVYALQLQHRRRLQAVVLAGAVSFFGLSSVTSAEDVGSDRLSDARAFLSQGQYFRAARYAFDAQQEDRKLSGQAYTLAAVGLLRAGLKNAASYFVIRALQTGSKADLRQLLPYTEQFMEGGGLELFRGFLLKYTSSEDYEDAQRGVLEYLLGRKELLKSNEAAAFEHLAQVRTSSRWYARARLARGAALAIRGNLDAALTDFRNCEKAARGNNLRMRCIAGQARTLYQMNEFEKAEDQYDRIPKANLIWTDTLYEMGWAAFSRQEFNRSLGRLVSYKSPALQFVFHPEIEVLRAQSFLALCLYVDAHDVVQDFYKKYAGVGEQIKKLIERNADNVMAFYPIGRSAMRGKLHTENMLSRVLNRFVRTSYFRGLVEQESALEGEANAIRLMAQATPSVPGERGGFPEFLNKILEWRKRSVWLVGGSFVKNSLIDQHKDFVDQLEKIAFIKLELLGRLKDRLTRTELSEARGGLKSVERKDHQYYWGFNGEFWNDELGDYVFALGSECRS